MRALTLVLSAVMRLEQLTHALLVKTLTVLPVTEIAMRFVSSVPLDTYFTLIHIHVLKQQHALTTIMKLLENTTDITLRILPIRPASYVELIVRDVDFMDAKTVRVVTFSKDSLTSIANLIPLEIMSALPDGSKMTMTNAMSVLITVESAAQIGTIVKKQLLESAKAMDRLGHQSTFSEMNSSENSVSVSLLSLLQLIQHIWC